MSHEPGDDAMERVRSLMIFSLDQKWKNMLFMHGCTFEKHERGETVLFPEGTTRTLLLSRAGQPTNRYKILFPDGLELREVLDDEDTGKSWLTLVLSLEPMQEGTPSYDPLQQRPRTGGETEEERREAKRIAYTIAAHTLRQAVSDEFLRFVSNPRLLVIYELHSLAEQIEKDAQHIIETQQEHPAMRERTPREDEGNV
jgi:hypothetical protein